MNKRVKRIADSETILTELMIPTYANFGGKVHGGILLSLMDKVAYVAASKHCGGYCVTVAVEGVEFLHPIEVGELVSLKASINYVGRTSMIIGIRVEALNPKTGKENHTNSCYFTMAAKDDNGKLAEVPGLLLDNEKQIKRFVEGMAIKRLSKEKRDLLKKKFAINNAAELKEMCKDENCKIDF